MQIITQQGVVDGQYNAALNANFAELGSSGGSSAGVVDVWVRPQAGVGNADGSYGRPYGSMALAAGVMFPGCVVGLEGTLFEEFTAPLINDVTLVGARSNQPRQATTSGVPNGGGATWMSPSGGTGTLLTLRGQAWKVQNIFFNNAATGGTTACINIDTVGDPPTASDASHAQILGCVLTGANFGIYAPLGPNYVTIAGCTFYNFASGSDTAISAAQSVRTLLGWKLLNNVFYNNVNHVVAALSRGTVAGNNFIIVGNSVTSTIALSLSGGAGNSVYSNAFNRPLDSSPNATLYVGGTNDVWGANIGSDNFFFGVPDNA